jgi:hypothetical protein
LHALSEAQKALRQFCLVKPETGIERLGEDQ